MSKINSYSATAFDVNTNNKTQKLFVTKSESTVSNLTTKDQISISTKQSKPYDVTQSKDFKTVFPNFSILDKSKQTEILNKLEFFQKKYPDFLTKLANIDNSKHGDGFQFFFVPDKNSPDYNKFPGIAVIDKAMGEGSIGIVFGGSSGVLENSILKNSVGKISQSIVNNGIFGKKFDESKITLDVGGMFSSVSSDTFGHEMTHVLHSYFLTNNERGELWSIYINSDKNKDFINDYSKKNHMEFFADGVEEYLRQDSSGNFPDRENLKKTNKKLYDFVAKVIEPDIKRTTTQSNLKSLGVITGYGIESGYNYLSNKVSALTKKVF